MAEIKKGKVIEITPSKEAPNSKYRFVPDDWKDERYRLTSIPMHFGQAPESNEIDISKYADQKITVEGDFSKGDIWVWNARVIE